MPISARASPRSWCAIPMPMSARPPCSRLSTVGWPSSRCRSESSSSPTCRATPWARCRRTCCARPIRISTRRIRCQGARATMTRDQAKEIQRHLLDADSAMDRARRAIAGLGKEDRVRFDDLLAEAIDVLQADVLAAIYDQHPDLEPPAEEKE